MYHISSLCAVFTTTAVCICVAAASTSRVLDDHQRELKDHYNHVSYVAGFQCRTPQPRAMSIHKLLANCETQDKAYFPDITVLYRCDCETGPCSSGGTCVPEHSDTLTLPFKVTFLRDIGTHRRGSWIMEYHTLDNHTQCSCLEGINLNL